MWGSPSQGGKLQEGSRESPPRLALSGRSSNSGVCPSNLGQAPLPFSVPHPRNEDYCLPHRGAMGSPLPGPGNRGTAVSLLRAPRLALR